ncbi:hypothetical protein FKP32DRAFT_1598086 [Trametes sanguinea]|nr:hypothetical protein FKP32DRAFT_1598086 [Trametes sanguinea]
MPFRWSSNPEANYVMIEPNVKYMLYTAQARANPPKAWYERPPPTPQKPVPVDKIRFLPTRRLQDAVYHSEPWHQVVADDLDSFSHVMLHAMLFAGKKRRDGSTASLSYAYRALDKHHPKVLMDWRDNVEDEIWRVGERVKKERAKGKEPDGATIDAIAEQLYAVFKVNIGQHSQERDLRWSYGAKKENVEDRWKKQYEDYLTAMEALAKAADEATTRKEEERRVKAEQKALKKAQQAEEEKAKSSKAVAEETAKDQTEQSESQDVPMEEQQDSGKGKGKAIEGAAQENPREADRADGEELDEPAAKRARLA